MVARSRCAEITVPGACWRMANRSDQTPRLLALVAIYDGGSRAKPAEGAVIGIQNGRILLFASYTFRVVCLPFFRCRKRDSECRSVARSS
jgi:hypothetical protein